MKWRKKRIRDRRMNIQFFREEGTEIGLPQKETAVETERGRKEMDVKVLRSIGREK